MNKALPIFALLAHGVFAWGNMEKMETKTYPDSETLILEFPGADLDLSFHDGTEIRVTNNEFTDPAFPLSASEGRLSFDAAAYRVFVGNEGERGEKPKYTLRVPATLRRLEVRADRIRVRPEFLAQARPTTLMEASFAGETLELRDLSPLPPRIHLEVRAATIRDASGADCGIRVGRDCALVLRNLTAARIAVGGTGRVAVAGHRVKAAEFAVGEGITGEAAVTASRIGSWKAPIGFDIPLGGNK